MGIWVYEDCIDGCTDMRSLVCQLIKQEEKTDDGMEGMGWLGSWNCVREKEGLNRGSEPRRSVD
jgi:hypothetical protein